MPLDDLSHFSEKSGTVTCNTPWGQWWQTVAEVFIEVNLPPGTKSRDVQLKITNSLITCCVHGNLIFEGELFRKVHGSETVWTIEDKKTINIVLSKADNTIKEGMWESLLISGGYQPDPWTSQEMLKKLDLERFQIENPGFDFSQAKLQKSYDKLPGWSASAMKQTADESCKISDNSDRS